MYTSYLEHDVEKMKENEWQGMGVRRCDDRDRARMTTHPNIDDAPTLNTKYHHIIHV